jgi:hypothetical protein
MSNSEKDLRNAKTGTDPDINFSYNELLTELEKEYKVESMRPGDITTDDMQRVTGLGRRQCQMILTEKVKKGELESSKVRNDKGFYINAYRKIDK